MAKPRLIGITYSPWSFKARWALRWHHIDYRYQEYLVMVGQLKLRCQLRQTSHATVPSMIAGSERLKDSFEIAKWADNNGSGPDLMTGDVDVGQWNQVSESLLRLGRIRCALSVQNDDLALIAGVPRPLNKLPGALALAKLGVRYILKTYPVDTVAEDLESQMATHLATVEKVIANQNFLLGKPCYADMAVASALQFVSPSGNHYIPMPRAVRAHWTSEPLAAQFAALLEWRDMVFEEMDAPTLGAK
jgi:glutathione S-transferase